MLHALKEYANRERLSALPGLKPKMVRWLLTFSSEGGFLGVVSLGGDDRKSKGRLFDNCPDLSQPEMMAVGGGCRHFLVDSLDVVALLTKDGIIDEKSSARHDYYVGLLERANECVPGLAAIAKSLRSEEMLETIRAALVERKAKPIELATLAVQDENGPNIFVDSDDWRNWWQTFRAELATQRKAKTTPKKSRAANDVNDDGPALMRCFLSGELVEPLLTHNKIEGLSDVGGLSMGDAFTSFDKDAFGSYGLEQGTNAAMSETMVKTYVTALNDLIRRHSNRMAGVKIVYWYDRKVEVADDPMPQLFGGADALDDEDDKPLDAEQERRLQEIERSQADSRAGRLLDAIRTGQRPELIDCRYYAATLSANSGRVVVRDWMEGRFEDLVQSIDTWFKDLAIVNLQGTQDAPLPKLETVVTCLLPSRRPKQDYEDWVRPIGTHRKALWQVALDGTKPISYTVMVRSLLLLTRFITNTELEEARDNVKRDALEIARMYCRLGILKAYHQRSRKGTVPMKEELMETHPRREYHCGRLMAVIAELQRVALAKTGENGRWTTVNAGVVQRYYAAASATPSLVFGRLIRTAQHHLGKMDGTPDKGYYVAIFNTYLTNVLNRIGETSSSNLADFPKTMDFSQQSLFALGYYHQIAKMNADRANAVAERNRNAGPDS